MAKALLMPQMDLVAFHAKFGLELSSKPVVPSAKTMMLRRQLILEEAGETCEAITDLLVEQDSEKIPHHMAKLADGIADSIYVLLGTAVSFGIDMSPVWDAVQTANMAKVGGSIREDGKILKPEGWKEPDILSIIKEQLA